MSKFFKKYVFLLAAAVALAGAAGFFYLKKGVSDHETYLGSVQERMHNQVDKARQDMERVLDLVPTSQDKPFTGLLLPDAHPYYLYRDSKLLVWSDYRYVPPDYDALSSARTETQALQTEQGKFLLLAARRQTDDARYEIFTLIPLQAKYQSGGNDPALFPLPPQALHLTPGSGGQAVLDAQGRVLFSLEPPDRSVYRSRSVPYQTLLLVSLAMLFLGVHVVLSVRYFRSRHRYGLGLGMLLLFVVLVRGLMLGFSIPSAFHEGTVFNPQNHLGSVLAPSLGDLLLNCLCVMLVLMYVNGVYFRTITYRRLARSDGSFQRLVSLLILLLGYVAYYLYYRELVCIYEKSSFTLDITLSITFDALKIAALAVFVVLSAIYFLLAHLIVSLFIRLNPRPLPGVAVLLASALLATLASWFMEIEFQVVFLAHLAYVLILYLTKLPRAFYGFRYPTTLYYFLGALVCAVMTTYVVKNQEAIKDVVNKREFGGQLVNDNDLFTEFLLKKNRDLIRADSALLGLFRAKPPLVQELVQQRVKNNYLDEHLGQYDVEVLSFDAAGQLLGPNGHNRDYAHYRSWYGQPEFATPNPEVFLVSGDAAPAAPPDSGRAASGLAGRKHYVSFIDLGTGRDSVAGHIVLDLRQRRQTPRSRYPELLLDGRLVQAPETREYSYAIYEGGRLMYSSGPYNYEQKFPAETVRDPVLYQKGVTLHGHRHVGQAGNNDRLIVVSSGVWGWRGLLANFSFLYLILVVVVSLAIFSHALHYGIRNLPLTYSTKIQVLLNAAFIMPLLIVLFFVLRVIGNNYARNQQDTQLSNTRNIAANVLGFMDDYAQGRMSRAYFDQQVQQIARDADLDINLYDTTGRMILSSKPLVYQSGLVSELINPLASRQIIEQKENQVLLDESLGGKNYRTAYAGLKSYDQRLLGVLSIPYFDSNSSLERQIIDIVASVLIVFTMMLLIFLFVSYLAANLLIDPLRALTRKISKTSLNQPNEPILWHSNDEIGTLIKKYNKMLVNLDSSKQELSSTEKQSAWREMAKQVAHEIKNPLTPMKLTLQQLQRTIRRDDPDALTKVSRAMESVIEQIDNIGYIAQSFSDIAMMPPPKKEEFEVTSVLDKAYELHSSDNSLVLHREIEPGPLYVNGDRQQFGASINNLIINARQSVPASRPPEITLKLYTHNDNVIVEVRDNGSGIPANIRSRVFLPNFTTREGGTGLGLAMAKRIIEYAGGSIWFETEEDVGTTFFLSLPLVKRS